MILIFWFSLFANSSLEIKEENPCLRVVFLGGYASCEGAEVEVQSTDRYTALMGASLGGHVDVVDFLLDSGQYIYCHRVGGMSKYMKHSLDATGKYLVFVQTFVLDDDSNSL